MLAAGNRGFFVFYAIRIFHLHLIPSHKGGKNRPVSMELQPEPGKWVFIVNPAAGGGKALRKCNEAERYLSLAGIEYERIDTGKAGDAEEICHSKIISGFKQFLVGGGDGSLNEVLQGIMKQKLVPSREILVAQLPVGTGNDWRRTYGMASNVSQAIEKMRIAKVKLQDVGRITYPTEAGKEDWFINSTGTGFDASVAFEANEKKKLGRGGLLVYISALLKQLFAFREPEMQIVIDGKAKHFSGFTVLAGVGKFAGNGMKLIPHGGLNDGFLSVVMVRKISRLKIVTHLASLFTGKFTRLKEVDLYKCKSIQITTIPEHPLQIDGESRGCTPVLIEILPKAVGILV